MATAQDRINRALRLIGATASGETPTAAESADALTALNAMLESWGTDKPTIYALQDLSYTLTPGDGTVTLGAASNITTRPQKIENLFIRANGQDYGIWELDKDEWFAIVQKAIQSSLPEYGYYESSFAVGVLNLYPVPSAAHELHVVCWVPITAIASLSTTVSLPPGYDRAIDYNLAIEVAPEYLKTPSQETKDIARISLAAVKRANARPMKMVTDLPMAVGRSDIYAGGYTR